MLTTKEFMVIIAALKASYENFKLDPTQMDFWYECLKDIPFEVLQVAVKKLVMTSPYIPKISEIRAYVAQITTPKQDQLTVDEAWGQVAKAIRRYGYMREIEALDSMSPAVAKVAKNVYKDFCMSDIEQVMANRSHFMKMYEASQGRAKEDRLISVEMQGAISQIVDKMSSKYKQIGQ